MTASKTRFSFYRLLPLIIGLLGVTFAFVPLPLPESLTLKKCPTFIKKSMYYLNILYYEQTKKNDMKLPLQTFTRSMLSKYDGSDEALPIYLGLFGSVLDVTKEKRFYGKNAPYACFAGRDATRALGLGSLDKYDIDLEGFIDDFSPADRKELMEQVEFYRKKYPLVGYLVYANEEQALVNISHTEQVGEL